VDANLPSLKTLFPEPSPQSDGIKDTELLKIIIIIIIIIIIMHRIFLFR